MVKKRPAGDYKGLLIYLITRCYIYCNSKVTQGLGGQLLAFNRAPISLKTSFIPVGAGLLTPEPPSNKVPE